MFYRAKVRTSRFGTVVAVAAILLAAAPLRALAAEFPFDREMLLDVRPLPGSKRVPILEIGADGRAQVDLWCKSGAAQVEVAGTTIRFMLGAWREDACTPERAERDQAMIAALSEVTRWHIENDVVILGGPMDLRFRLSTH
jgi:heat shock protein HslJ